MHDLECIAGSTGASCARTVFADTGYQTENPENTVLTCCEL